MSKHFSDPRETVLQMGLSGGMKVVDLGSGPGHYAQAAAGVVGAGGKVYAIDIQEEVLHHAKREHGALHHHHRQGVVESLWGDIERVGGTGLRDRSVDAAILANVLFQIQNRPQLVAEVRRVVKPGGKLLVVDWAGSYGGMGPTPGHVVSEHEAEGLFIGNGFHKVKSFRSGPHHYAIVFTLPNA